MSDMPSDFWSGWITVLTLTSLAGLAWLTFSAYFSETTEEESEHEPVWDGNLREGSNPAPMWWFWLILSLMVMTVVYLMLYPGLGSYRGALKWTQSGHLDDTATTFDTEFGGVRQLIAEARIETLQDDVAIMQSAQRVFDRNCAVCHGYDAAGQANLFPDLTDDEWQWGGSEAQITQSIVAGRSAVMVGWGQVLGDEGVQNVAAYVQALGSDAANGHPGLAQYNQFCVACHGIDGAGNAALGAPSLTDDVTLYGNDTAALIETIANGRNGQMPAFGSRLDETQVRLLTALLANTTTN